MSFFCLGDQVRVAGLPSSEWQNRQGTIVEILEQSGYEQGDIAQECAVDVGGDRRWFMAKHLVKTVPARLVRFFQTEVSDRWHLEPTDVDSLKGDCPELIGLLCDRLNLAKRRAEAEVDDFFTEFNDRIARAVEQSPSKQVPLYDRPDDAIHLKMPKPPDAA